MTPIKRPDSGYLIPIATLCTCLIDGLTRVQILKLYTREQVGRPKACYYLDKLTYHLTTKHGIDLKTYCKQHLDVEWPLCPGTGAEVGYRIDGSGIILYQYAHGGITKATCAAFADSCERASIERTGDGNPMHGKPAWNAGLTAETDERMAKVSARMMGNKPSPESIEKGRQKKLGRPSKTKGKRIHSDERREWFKEHTASLWRRGVFSKVSGIHVKMREFLATLPLNEAPQEETTLGPFSLDFGFVSAKIGIEADGDYYHVNPDHYPNGPENAMQRRNHGRDKSKNAYAATCGWTLLRYWEHDINSGAFKDPLICRLRELSLLD